MFLVNLGELDLIELVLWVSVLNYIIYVIHDKSWDFYMNHDHLMALVYHIYNFPLILIGLFFSSLYYLNDYPMGYVLTVVHLNFIFNIGFLFVWLGLYLNYIMLLFLELFY